MRRMTNVFGVFIAATHLIAGGLFNLNTTSKAAGSELDRNRQLLVDEFAASADFIAFPVILASNSAGLFFLNRKSSERKIIYADSTEFRSPYISKDGARLLFVQRKLPQEDKELVSCKIANWQCETVLKTTATISSAVELTADTYLYASSPVRTVQGRRRTDRHNFFFLKKGAAPIQLTDFDRYQLGPMSVAGERLLFSAAHGPFDKEFSPAYKVLGPNSDIFSARLTDAGRRIVLPDLPLKALFLIEGDSSKASIAEDGEHIAFINRRNEPGKPHFNLAIGDKNESGVAYIKAKEYGFSQPIFVKQSIVANELLHDRYEVKEYAFSGSEQILFKIDHSVGSLKKLPQIVVSRTP